jgi:hypothetical protein
MDFCALITSIDHIVQQEKITEHLQMNYNNYERKIVEAYSLELFGWPEGRVRNPGKLGGHDSAMRLLATLKNNSCWWVKLEPKALEAKIARNKELTACSKSIYKPCKNTTHPCTSKFKSQATIKDSDDSDGIEDEPQGNEEVAA